jgi:mRNA interferase MazF
VPVTAWNEKKSHIVTNVELHPTRTNGLTKLSIADCLQARPIDFAQRFVQERGRIDTQTLMAINNALMLVFGLS